MQEGSRWSSDFCPPICLSPSWPIHELFPARYCTGFLVGDIGNPRPHLMATPGAFWMLLRRYLDGHWLHLSMQTQLRPGLGAFSSPVVAMR